MSTYSKRQNKKTLGIENIKGVSVINVPNGKKFNVKYKAEAKVSGTKHYGGMTTDITEATQLANKLFASLYGNKRSAQKAGYWNA